VLAPAPPQAAPLLPRRTGDPSVLGLSPAQVHQDVTALVQQRDSLALQAEAPLNVDDLFCETDVVSALPEDQTIPVSSEPPTNLENGGGFSHHEGPDSRTQ